MITSITLLTFQLRSTVSPAVSAFLTDSTIHASSSFLTGAKDSTFEALTRSAGENGIVGLEEEFGGCSFPIMWRLPIIGRGKDPEAFSGHFCCGFVTGISRERSRELRRGPRAKQLLKKTFASEFHGPNSVVTI
ncbi:hypothetical protein V6N13_080318 [Hibiscus sabdariffa]